MKIFMMDDLWCAWWHPNWCRIIAIKQSFSHYHLSHFSFSSHQDSSQMTTSYPVCLCQEFFESSQNSERCSFSSMLSFVETNNRDILRASSWTYTRTRVCSYHMQLFLGKALKPNETATAFLYFLSLRRHAWDSWCDDFSMQTILTMEVFYCHEPNGDVFSLISFFVHSSTSPDLYQLSGEHILQGEINAPWKWKCQAVSSQKQPASQTSIYMATSAFSVASELTPADIFPRILFVANHDQLLLFVTPV